MGRIPFTVYDFFAYLSSGALIVGAVDFLYGHHWLQNRDIGIPLALLLLFLSYVSGHAVAHFSSLFLEQLFVGKVLKRPSRTLMGEQPASIVGWLFPGYYRSLPHETQQRIWKRAEARNFSGTGESLFLHVFSVMTQDERLQRRLDEFRNLYGFSRNLCFALVVTAILFGSAKLFLDSEISFWWCALASGLGIIMLYRYLKFFRQYSYQLFIAYSEMPID